MSYQSVRQVADESHIEMPRLGVDEGSALKQLPHNRQSGRKSWTRKLMKFFFSAALLGITGTLFYKVLSSHSFLAPINKPAVSDTALFDDKGRYIVRNFDQMKPNANFLAGLGGLWGVPMVSISARTILQSTTARAERSHP